MSEAAKVHHFELGDFALDCGVTLPKAQIAYTTYGTLNPGKDNVIVFPTWFVGSHLDVEWMIGDGKPLDTTKYFVVVAHMFANGHSSSPSNTPVPFDRGRFPKIKVQIRRSQSSKIPTQLVEGDLELGVTSYDPGDPRLATKVLYNDALAFIVSPKHRLAKRRHVSIAELGKETFIAHNVLSPYRDVVLREFRRHKVPLNMDVEMPTLETIRRLVQNDEGVAFLPRMCVRHDVETGAVREITVKELHVERKVRLLYSKARTLSHAARAFLELVLTPT